MADKKEYKKLEAKEILSRIDGFLETQKLDVEAKYFLTKQLNESYWKGIRIDEDEELEDFYDETDYMDDDEDYEDDVTDDALLEPSNTEQPGDSFPEEEDEKETIDEIETTEIDEDIDVNDDDVNDLLASVDEEKTVEENKEKEKLEKKRAKKK